MNSSAILQKRNDIMQGKTHLRIGLATGVAVGLVTSTDFLTLTITVAVAAIASMIPDIDEDGSKINKWLFSSLDRKWRSLALASVGVVICLFWYGASLPLWVLLTGIYATGVAYVPHRSVTHSLIGMSYVLVVAYLSMPSYLYAVAAGYFSHLLADAFTVAGVPFLWPYPKKVGLKTVGLEIRTGRETDKYLGRVTLVIACVGYVYLLGKMYLI
jgi:inner membrane protein